MSKVYIASDHAGFALKQQLIPYMRTLGHKVEDLGDAAPAPEDDYPDFIGPLASKVAAENSVGIAIGGSGQGEAMVANRVTGARAAVFYGPIAARGSIDGHGGAGIDVYDIIRLSRLHNNANILSLGARFLLPEQAEQAVKVFLETAFSGDARHVRRLAKF